MPGGILFVILPEGREAKVAAFVSDLIVPGARESVQVLTDAVARLPPRDMRSQVTAGLIERISAFPSNADNKLIIDREARCSIAELTDWWRDRAFGKAPVKLSPAAINRTIKQHLEESGQHWRTHALGEIAKFDGPQGNLDAWLQQFGVLGVTVIGRKLAAQLRVIRSRDLPDRPFSLRASDLVGYRQVRCYVQDDDPGGSWLDMQAILTHACPPGTVHPVRWEEERLIFPDVPADEFVIYEDGLWSGSEAVRRLRAIAAAPPPVPVILRFGVVTDFGLRVVRHAIRSLDLNGRVSVDASPSELIRFLADDLPEALHLGLGEMPERYFAALHPHVMPYAFKEGSDWTDQEVEACRVLGQQLVRHWLSHRTDDPPPSAKVDRFALGGGGFASTVVFSRSIPKVCLPLLWLNGPVELEGRRLHWKPLFVDARRVSDISLLH